MEEKEITNRQSQTNEQITLLENTIVSLSKEISVLISQLKPILKEHGEEKAKEEAGVGEALIPLASEIKGLRNKLRVQIERIGILESRIEI